MEFGKARMMLCEDHFEFTQDAIDLIFGDKKSDEDGYYLSVLYKPDREDMLWLMPCDKNSEGARRAADAERHPLQVQWNISIMTMQAPWLADHMTARGAVGILFRAACEEAPGVTACAEIIDEGG